MDVLCVGIAVADALGKPVDVIPEKARLALFDTLELHTGGCAVNTAIALSKIGVRTGVVARVGDDAFGQFIISELERYSVDTRGIRKDKKHSTSFTFIMISSDGERRFLHTFGANAHFCLEDIDLGLLKETRVVHVAGSYLMPAFDGPQTAEFLKKAKSAGVTTCMDTAFNDRVKDWFSIVKPCLPYLDLFLPSIEEAEKMSGKTEPADIAKFFVDNGAKTVGIKLGGKGSFVYQNGVGETVPIYKVKVVDTSGAGDSFVAGFLAGYLEGWDIVKCARFGNAVAAHCIQAIGCTAGVPDRKTVLKFQKDYKG